MTFNREEQRRLEQFQRAADRRTWLERIDDWFADRPVFSWTLGITFTVIMLVALINLESDRKLEVWLRSVLQMLQ